MGISQMPRLTTESQRNLSIDRNPKQVSLLAGIPLAMLERPRTSDLCVIVSAEAPPG